MEYSSLKKYTRLKWLIPILVTGIISAFTFPPEGWQDRVLKALAAFGKNYPQEKVYLHLDKDYYAAGETIWYKAYVMMQNQPSLTVMDVYVELLDKNGIVVMKKHLPAGGASAAGNFELPETMKPGQYQLRAYTAWMLNFDPGFLCYRNIEIFDPSKRNNLPPRDTPVVKEFSVQFFPEGGNLLEGTANTVAFKAIDQNGYPIAVIGDVKDSKGKTVASIKTIHDGMGSFELTPTPGSKYYADVQITGGQHKSITLPPSVKTGASLKLFNRGSRIFYQATIANPEDTSFQEMMVVAQVQQQLVYKASLSVAEGRISGFIPTQYLPSGIVQVTLFSNQGLPISERLAFVKKNDQLTMYFENPVISTEERDRNTIELIIPDTLKTSLSVSVTDADQVMQSDDQNNIISHLLLTSDLKGYIHNPAWYFQDSTQAKAEALDLVMLTNGWRRFSWEKILKDSMPLIRYPYEQGLSLKGKAYTKGRFPLANGKVDLIFKQLIDSSTGFTSVPTNSKGEFDLGQIQFLDTVLVYHKGNDKEKAWKDVEVEFDSHFFEKSAPVTFPYPMRPPALLDNSALQKFLTTAWEGNRVNRSIASRAILLKEVNIREKRITPAETMDKKYTSGMFTTGDGYSFDLSKETPTAFNVFQYLQSKVAGLQITGDYNNPSLSWRGGKPGLYLNEMPVDVSMLTNVNINDIALVKVFRPPFMGGFGGGAGGAIAVYTKKGGDNTGDSNVRGFTMNKKVGYSVVKEFYSPDYAVHKETHALADKRLTLYWNPHLQVDSVSHTAKIKFYNNDFSKHFRVVVEGIAEDGRMGRVEQVF